ncbi:hypothetical protein ACJJTC_013600 [Scirpophaga incertulas]
MPKMGGVTVERVRKVKDRKIVVGLRTEEAKNKMKERLKGAQNHLRVEDVQNKDPMVVLKDVLNQHTDEDIKMALENQNKDIFAGIDRAEAASGSEQGTRTTHISLCGGSEWRTNRRWSNAQCASGYGHGRKFCKENIEKCSHCSGPSHQKAKVAYC